MLNDSREEIFPQIYRLPLLSSAFEMLLDKQFLSRASCLVYHVLLHTHLAYAGNSQPRIPEWPLASAISISPFRANR